MGKENMNYTYTMKQGPSRIQLVSTDVDKDSGVYTDKELLFDHQISESVEQVN